MKQVNVTSAFLAAVFGFLATAMIFLPALGYENSEAVYLGMDVVFGIDIVDLGSIASGKILFNILALGAFALPVIASICVLVLKKGYVIAGLLFIAAMILLVMLPSYTKITVEVFGNTTEYDIDWVMQYGIFLAIGFSFLGAVFSILQGVKTVQAS